MTTAKAFRFEPKVVIAVLLIVVIGAVIAFMGTRSETPAPANAGPVPGELPASEIEPMLAKLRTVAEVPDEMPKALPIDNAEEARSSQAFLERAENGDVLLLFFTAKLALLYRPSTNAIIASGPLNDGPPPADAASAQ